MPLGPYKSLRSIPGFTARGTIDPSQLPATECEFKFDYELDISIDPTDGFNTQQLKAQAGFEVYDSGNTLLLKWEFYIVFQLTTLDVSFAWNVVTQTIVVSPPLPLGVLGDPNGIAIPGGDTSYAAGDTNIQQEFVSPIYKVSLPPGAWVKLVDGTARFPDLKAIASLQVRTQQGGAWATGVRPASDGTLVALLPGTNALSQVLFTGPRRDIQPPQPLAWGADTAAFMVRSPGGAAQVVVYGKGGSVLARTSRTDGSEYGDAVTLYTGFVPLAATLLGGGKTLLLLTNPQGAGFVAYRDAQGNWSKTPLPATLPDGVTLSSPGVLLGGSHAEADFVYPDLHGNALLLKTKDDGITWQ